MIPIHIGLSGHVDAGKTSIARGLTEVISTAGLINALNPRDEELQSI